jgi:hypothetical protein
MFNAQIIVFLKEVKFSLKIELSLRTFIYFSIKNGGNPFSLGQFLRFSLFICLLAK